MIEESGKNSGEPRLALPIIRSIYDMPNARWEVLLIYTFCRSPDFAKPGGLPGSGALLILIINECV